MFRGRKVTDPVVQGTTSTGFDPNPGLSHAWDTVDKAKSEIRKIEQRLDEVDRPLVSGQLNQTGETSITDYGGLHSRPDHNDTFNVHEDFTSGAVVDNYGRSAYLRSKTQAARKVSRLDDKYVEDTNQRDSRRKKSSSKENHAISTVKQPKAASLPSKAPPLQEKRYKPETSYGSRNVSSGRRVEFSDHVGMREHYTGSENHRYLDKNYHSLPNEQSTLTDSRDIRETEINFLNNNLTRNIDNDLLHNHEPGNKLTHVSVHVPGSSRVTSAGPTGKSGVTARRPGTTQGTQGTNSHFLDMIGETDAGISEGSYSDSGDSAGKGRLFKGDIRRIDPNGLAKIKETIRKQIKSSSTNKDDENIGATGGNHVDSASSRVNHVDSASTRVNHVDSNPSQRVLHEANQAIVPRSQDLIDGSEKTVKVRKIAAGPAAPSYKGFSETETKYRTVTENKVPKSYDARKDKKRQVSLKFQDKRIDPIGNWLTVEENEVKNKKPTRVIAPSRKPSKQQPQPKNKDIIRTDSWRSGQEAILRELGPYKVKKSSKTKDNYSDIPDGRYSPTEERPESLVGEESPGVVGSATAAEIQQHRALSEEARRVYNDLQMDDTDDRPTYSHNTVISRDKHYKHPGKRKAPKSLEPEKQPAESSAKQRHYDPDQVRKFMQKKKAERLRQQREEEQRHKEEEKMRRRQLEELYNKQKSVTTTSTTSATSGPGKRDKGKHKPCIDVQTSGGVLSDLPRHHPFHTDRVRFVVSSDSENKENHQGQQQQDMDVSDSSSTITGDGSMEDLTPNTTPRRKMDIDLGNIKKSVNSREVTKTNNRQKPSLQPIENSSNIKTIGDFSFDVGGVMSKFTQALHEKLNEEPPSLAGTCNGVGSQDQYRSIPNDGTKQLSHADRLKAIKDTADTLQNRLKEEARNIQAQSANRKTENGAITRGHVRWTDSEPHSDTRGESRPPGRRDREEEFMSRYERVTAANDDFTVFKNNLPGAQSSMKRPDTDPRLHTTASKPAPLATGHRNGDIGEDTTVTETSTFSEITLTDDSDNELSTDRKIGSGLQQRDFHSGGRSLDKVPPPNIPRPAPTGNKGSNYWDEPAHDDYNVFSIYSRKQQERVVRPGREPMSKKKPSSIDEPDTRAVNTQSSMTAAPRSASTTAGPRSTSTTAGPSKAKTGAARSRSPAMASQKSESLRTQSPRDSSKRRHRMDEVTSDEDTLKDDSYTQSFETEDKTTSRARSVSDKIPASHKSLPPSLKTASVKSTSMKTSSKVTDRLTPDVDSSIDEDISQEDMSAGGERVSTVEPVGPPRLSPNSLERKFYTEFNNLESMEASLKQLTGVERTRGISMAQQETVSLAQILKANKQSYDLKMAEVQNMARTETTEATKQYQDLRTKVRSDEVAALQDTQRQLLETQLQSSKVNAETAKLLSDARALGFQDTNRLAVETAAAAAASAVTTALENKYYPSRQTKGSKPTPVEKSAKRRSEEADHDDSESVGSADDYSIQFDESMTEDEREEKSFRLILPSESHRKKGKHIHSDNESMTSEGSAARLLEVESFDKFTEDIVHQFMKEEEMRAQHQASLLRLRESALVEKTKAELAWLEQQKQRMRNKGADDSYPGIVKRQRGLKMKLQEEQANIRRLREANKAAAKERQRALYQEISKRQSQQSKSAPKKEHVGGGRLGRPTEVHTEAEVSSIDEASDAERSQRKTVKSDSEIYTEPKIGTKKSRSDARSTEKYKKINLDEKYLTQRQTKLMDRRKNAEELLKWKKKLDAEENRIFMLEKKALKVWNKDDVKEKEQPSQSVGVTSTVVTAKDETETKPSVTSKKDNGTTKDTSTIRTGSVSAAVDSTLMSDAVSTARDESLYTSIKESIKTASTDSPVSKKHLAMMNDKSNIKNHHRSGSDSSIPEEMQSLSSVDDSHKKLNESSDDTMTPTYIDTFEDTTTNTATKKTPRSKSQPSSKSPLEKLRHYTLGKSPHTSPRSLFNTRSHTRNSESESEDSISLTESQSELSDFEGRIRALNEELRRRKTEADKLKRERKKKKRDQMKNKEETLKKQIEVYDSQIAQLKVELQKETHEPAKTTVRPVIKHPKVSPPKQLKKVDTTPPKHKTDTDSSGPDSSQVSPTTPDDQKKVVGKGAPVSIPAAKVSLDRISEGSESQTSRSEISEQPSKYSRLPTKGSADVSAVDDGTDEISEDISVASTSEVSDKSKEIKIDLRTKEDIYDVSVSYDLDDFTGDPTTQHDKLNLSARSMSQMSDMESKTIPKSARSVTEQISEYISEALPSASASEAFIKPPDDAQTLRADTSERDDSDADISQSYSIRSDSRPSSGKSDRSSIFSMSHAESSESDKSPKLQTGNLIDFEVESEAKSEPKSVKAKAGGLIAQMGDIDDLLGEFEEEITPVASPQETPRDRTLDDGKFNFTDVLSDFEIGDHVCVTGTSGERLSGTLLFKGAVNFAPGVWAGVELDEPLGRHNGVENGVRYFHCHDGHGLIVPGDDLTMATEGQPTDMLDVRSSVESNEDIFKYINEADKNVQMFDSSPEPSPRTVTPRDEIDNKAKKEQLADKITGDIFAQFLKENVGAMSLIAEKKSHGGKTPPPVAPKPKHTAESSLTNGDIVETGDDHSEHLDKPESETNKQFDNSANMQVKSLMNDALDHMLSIRNNRQNQDKDASRDSGNFTDIGEEHVEVATSPTDELQGVLDKHTDDMDVDTPLRPGSPVPGLQSHQDSHAPVVDSGNFDAEYDDELWVPNKAPPPYPGGENDVRSEISRSELKKLTEEVFYAVPHKTEEINKIVSSAVEEFWIQRRYGETLVNLQPSQAYFTQEERGADLISNSQRVFKKLLFDLTGEIIRTIYREEEYDPNVAWHKRKRRQNKYYKGSSVPRTVDVLKPAVQQAIVDILGLNGAKKGSEKTKWGVRKKKDLVDTILVQELREEEPEWVNYDDDELAVKMQLTETIFENLLTDTVHTMNKIFRKKQSQVSK